MENQSKINQTSIKNQSKIHQNSIKNPPKIDLGGVLGSLGASWGVLAASWGVLGRLGRVSAASWGVLGASWWATWLQLGSQNGAKIDWKSKQKTIKILMPLRIGFLKDFSGFWRQNGSMLASKIEQKSMLSSRGDFLKKPCFSLGKTMILKDPGVEVGSKNRSKNYQKRRSTWEGILTSIFHRFWWILGAKLGGKIEPRSIKNGTEKLIEKRRAARWMSWASEGSRRPTTDRDVSAGGILGSQAGQYQKTT